MPNRIIKESVNESRGLSNCSFFAQDLYKRLIVYADDYGRFNADPQIMLARMYPRELNVVGVEDIIDALGELCGVEKIGFYTAAPRREVYGAFPNWSDHQRVRDSKKKNPDPTDTTINDWYLRRFIPLEMKVDIINRDGFKCAICGKQIAEGIDAKRFVKMCTGTFHIDHIVPCNQGGRATMENLRLTCPKCNLSRKRSFDFGELIEIAKNCGNSPQPAANVRSLPPNPIQSESNPNPNPNPIINAEEAADIAADHDRILNAAETAGFARNDATRAKLIDLYATHGLQKVLDGIGSCVDHGVSNIAYLTAVLKGEPKRQKPTVNAQNYEQRDYSGSDSLTDVISVLQGDMRA